MTEKLGHWEKRLLKLIEKWGPLIEEHRDNETHYFVEGYGKVGGRAPKALIERKLVIPANDALFSGCSQTYVAAHG